MPDRTPTLSRRERQIMDVIYRLGSATSADVLEHIPDPPSYSAVRAMLRVLEDKGHLRHRQDGPRYLYQPTVARDRARRSALQHVVRTFFDGSATAAMAALLDLSDTRLTEQDRARIEQLIERAQEEGQ